jgi:hypothetical protein
VARPAIQPKMPADRHAAPDGCLCWGNGSRAGAATYVQIDYIHENRRIFPDGQDFPSDMADNPRFNGSGVSRKPRLRSIVRLSAANVALRGIVADGRIIVGGNSVLVKDRGAFGSTRFMQLIVREDAGINKNPNRLIKRNRRWCASSPAPRRGARRRSWMIRTRPRTIS